MDLKFTEELDEKLISLILATATKKKHAIGEVIISEGMHNNMTGFILSGVLKVHLENNENSLLLYYISSDNNPVINLMNMVNQLPISFSITVIKETTVLWVPNDKILEWGNDFESLKNLMINSCKYNIECLMVKFSSLMKLSTEERVMKYLNEKAIMYNNKILILSHIEMASDLNVSRYTISRMLKKLSDKKKIIERSKNVIVVV